MLRVILCACLVTLAMTQQAGTPLPPVARKMAAIKAMAALKAASAMKPSRRSDTATVELGEAGTFTILSKAGISTVDSAINGDVGVSLIAATALTGFSLTLDPSTTMFSTSAQITGQAFAADYGTPFPLLVNSLFLTPRTPQLHFAS